MVTDDVWHRLRSMRSAPPGKASKGGARAALFRAALEQAEQLSVSAAASEYAARPIPLYYALNQAARAIVAVGGTAEATNSHGLKASPLDGPLQDIGIRVSGTGLFGALGVVLQGSGWLPWTGDQRLGPVWASLPRCGTYAARSGAAPACALAVDWNAIPWVAMDGVARVSGWPWALSTLRNESEGQFATRCDKLLLEHYRLKPGWRIGASGTPISFSEPRVGGYSLTLDFAPRDEKEEGEGGGFIGDPYLPSALWLYPSIFENGLSVHPLQLWYATLYSFSMLARYAPVQWRAHLDVDSSGFAVPLQMTLDQALADVPVLIEHELGRA